MKVHMSLLAAVGATLATASIASAQIAAYSQDFESLDALSATALSADGWVVYVNVYNDAAKTSYAYGYVYGGAPNGTGDVSDIAAGEGGVDQGTQQMSVYSAYSNADHANGLYIETNVYREIAINSDNIGQTWTFTFDYKKGNLAGGSTAEAFIKTLDPNNGYATTNLIEHDTATSDLWQTGSISLDIDSGLVGQVFQIGVQNTATMYEDSGVFYDNINLVGTGGVCGIADVDGNGTLNLDDINIFAQAFVAGCDPSPPPGTNELVNGSFETPGIGFEPFDTWMLFGNVLADDNTEVTAQDGFRSCKMYGGFYGPGVQSDTGCFQDNIPVDENREYTLSGWTYMLSSDPLAPLDFADPDMNGSFGHLPLLICDFKDGSGTVLGTIQVNAFDVGIDPADTWVYKEVTGVAPEGSVTCQVTPLFIQFGDDPGSLFYDNISLESGDINAPCSIADMDANGVLNLDDINLFAQAFVAGCP